MMLKSSTTRLFLVLALALLPGTVAAAEKAKRWTETATPDGYVLVENPGGATLGYHPASGVKLLDVDGLAFKDLNRNGKLDIYEDWRRPAGERAADLAKQLSEEEIAGLMLFSRHQNIAPKLTDEQRQFLADDNVRAVLFATYDSKRAAALWNNEAQAFTESVGKGVPVNISSDPRHSTSTGEAYSTGTGEISLWPGNLGLAATFEPERVLEFARIASEEYRALGIATALSPQIDAATEPRWLRVTGTFGEDIPLATDMARAYVDGFQTTPGAADGWGARSVNTMIKHWPGDGAVEKGRESHSFSGKYAVYPGGNFEGHLRPFVDGALRLDGPTGGASAVMPSYAIAFATDDRYGEQVGSGYSKWKITDILREKHGFTGVVCTDWGIVGRDDRSGNLTFEKDGLYQPLLTDDPRGFGRAWGYEYGVTLAERFYKVLEAGVDQFGGVNTAGPLVQAFAIGAERIGKPAMRARIEQSATRLLMNVFHPGLFENPYLSVEETVNTVGKPEYMQAGYEAQLASVVMLKNRRNLIAPAAGKKTVYIPMRFVPAVSSYNPTNRVFEETSPAMIRPVIDIEAAKAFFDVVTDRVTTAADAMPKPEDITRLADFTGVDFALVAVANPFVGATFDFDHYKFDEVNLDPSKGPLDNGYRPISLQYRRYVAPFNEHTTTTLAVDRYEEQVWVAAGGQPGTSRSYAGKAQTVRNTADLDLILDTRKAVGLLPVAVIIRAENPMVFHEFESVVDAILMGFGVSDQAILEIIAGRSEPRGLLPLQMPRDMGTVEANREDVAGDLDVHVDTEGNAYDFAYGLDWNGVIRDARTEKYGRR